jgi:hypothetical protein
MTVLNCLKKNQKVSFFEVKNNLVHIYFENSQVDYNLDSLVKIQ